MSRAETPRRVPRVRRPEPIERLRLLAVSLTLLAAPLLIVDNLPSTPAVGEHGVELGAALIASVEETTTTVPEAEPAPPVEVTTTAPPETAPPETRPPETTTTTAPPETTTTTSTTTTTAPPPPPEPAPQPASGPPPGDVWHRLAQCESSGNWAHSGGRYHGGLQFLPSTWNAYGGQEFATYAYQATPAQQIAVAERVVAASGGTFQAWPACRAKLGLP